MLNHEHPWFPHQLNKIVSHNPAALHPLLHSTASNRRRSKTYACEDTQGGASIIQAYIDPNTTTTTLFTCCVLDASLYCQEYDVGLTS